MSTSAPPPPSFSSSTISSLTPTSATAPHRGNTQSQSSGSRNPEASRSILQHTEVLLQLIENQRALAAREALSEAEAARREVGRLDGELKQMRAQFGRVCEEMEGLRGENERLWERAKGREGLVGVKVKEEGREIDLRGMGPVGVGPSPSSNEESAAAMKELQERCEALERENERLRVREANLVQRIEIFESLRASVGGGLVDDTDRLPDLNGAMDRLKARLFASAGEQTDGVQAKKRRLDQSPSA